MLRKLLLIISFPISVFAASKASGHLPATNTGLNLKAGKAAYIVFNPSTALEKHVTNRLSDYLTAVLKSPAKLVANISAVPAGIPAIVMYGKAASVKKSNSPEAYTLESQIIKGHPAIIASGNTILGLKHAVQRLIIESEQRSPGLVVKPLHIAESPWIAQREWTLCPWSPSLVRGVFSNPNADKRLNVWLYSDQQIADYVDMFDSFGFSGCQLMETVASYSVLGSADAFQDRELKFAKNIRKNGQHVTLWVWAAQFNDYGWFDKDITYTPKKGNTAFTDSAVRAGFEKYYNGYAKMAPYADMLITHFYDPGSLKNRADVFNYMRLLLNKFKAKNPDIKLGVDFWASASDAEYMQQLIDNGFTDATLLESSMPHLYPPGKREALNEEARKHNLKIGVWGWHTAEIETDQNPMMHVNADLLSKFYREVRDGADKIQHMSYWSEMEAYHLNNIFTMYAAGQLLWNPDRSPDEILSEIANGIWGPHNGPQILKALKLIQDTRSGPTWDTYWMWTKQFRLGTANPNADLQTATECIAAFEQMKTDDSFVPKFPLPFPPATFVELMLPSLREIQQLAKSRVDIAKIREAAAKGVSKTELSNMVTSAWTPVLEYNNWIGMFGEPEAAVQEKMFNELVTDLGLQVAAPRWVRWRDANRLLQVLQNRQRNFAGPYVFKSDEAIIWRSFNWTKEKGFNRFELLLDNGCLEKAGTDTYRLADWQEFKRNK